MIPEKPADGNWTAWCDKHYPFDPRWERHLQTRTERPVPGSDKQLDDLRGLRDRATAGDLAKLWFWSTEHQSQIEAEQRRMRTLETERETKRLIRIAKLALDGKLGDTRDDRDAAQATAQSYLGSMPPERCSIDELRDWEKMHRFAKAVANGENPAKPVLSRDRKQQARQKQEIADLDDAIGAQRYEQQGLYP